jgi:hypothetical protein
VGLSGFLWMQTAHVIAHQEVRSLMHSASRRLGTLICTDTCRSRVMNLFASSRLILIEIVKKYFLTIKHAGLTIIWSTRSNCKKVPEAR